MERDIKFAFRRILSGKLFSLINIIGLTIGLSVVTILTCYIYQESSYDHYHNKANRTYKLISKFFDNEGNSHNWSITMGILADQYKSQFPQVEDAALFYGPNRVELDVDQNRFNNIRIIYTDYSFPEIFDFPGYRSGTFKSPADIIISSEAAVRLFSGSDPVGKNITISGVNYRVSGVVDIPNDTRFEFDAMAPLNSYNDLVNLKEGGLEFETYVVLNETSNDQNTLTKLATYYNEKMVGQWPLWVPENYLLPLTDVYLNGIVRNRTGNGNKLMLYVIGSIAFIILLLALINYLNLQIASNHSRQIEIKIKKVMGASKTTLIKQSIIESLLLTMIASAAALVLVELFFNIDAEQLMDTSLLTVSAWPPSYWLVYTFFTLLIGILSGLIPAIGLSRISGLANHLSKSTKLGSSTVALVIFQFFVAASLLSAILFINLQMNYLRDLPLGFSNDNIIIINNLNKDHKEKYQIIKNELLTHSGILSVSGSQSEPGPGTSGQFIWRADTSEDAGIAIDHVRVIDGYIETFEMELVAGEGFSKKQPGGDHEFLINQTAYRKLFPNGENAIGAALIMGDRHGTIVGVMKDYHYRSFHHDISPIVLNIEDPYNLTLALKIEPTQLESISKHLEQTLAKIDPIYTLNYHFMDESFDLSYRAELRTKRIITYSTIIAFSISILGLLALSIFVINAKTKEIAIRKTLGANEGGLLWQLSNKLLLWIVIGNILATPMTFYLTNKWLDGFIYQVAMSNLLWIMPVCTLITLSIAFSAIIYKLWITVRLNPIVFLKYE